MTRHPRIPALVAVLVSAGLGFTVLAATGQFRSTDLSHTPLAVLEKRIVNCTEPAVWCAYGDKLREISRFDSAARAYQHALALQPDIATATAARINIAVALGQSRDAEAFFAYFGRLSVTYPKLTVDLLERPELAALRADARWDPIASNARAQAVD